MDKSKKPTKLKKEKKEKPITRKKVKIEQDTPSHLSHGQKEFKEPKIKLSRDSIAVILVLAFFSSIVIYYIAYQPKSKLDLLIEKTSSELAIKEVEFDNTQEKNLDDINYIKHKLHFMVKKDQYARESLVKSVLKNKNNSVEDDEKNREKIRNFIRTVDRKNSKDLEEILYKYGWIRISLFGQKADNDAWILVQHADDNPLLQHRVLFMLEQLYQEGETNKQNYALLYDKIAVKYLDYDIKQKFGTQGQLDDNRFQIFNYLGTQEELNSRREEFGFESIGEYIDSINSRFSN